MWARTVSVVRLILALLFPFSPQAVQLFKELTLKDADAALSTELDKLVDTIPESNVDSRLRFRKEMDGFHELFKRYLDATSDAFEWDMIQPLPAGVVMPYNNLPSLIDKESTRQQLNKLVVVKLNGGLGTTMGCTGPKSLISVRSDLTFLDLTVQQIEDTDVHNANGQEHTPTNCTGRCSPLMAKTDANDTAADIGLDDSIGDTMFLETRDPEPEELALLLRDPLPPSGLLLATTESVQCFTTDNVPVEPILCDETRRFTPNLTSCEKTLSACRLANRLIPLHSFIRLHEDRLTAPDSVLESTGVSPVSVTGDYPSSLVADSVKLRSSVASCPNRQETSAQISNLGVSKRSVSVNMPNMSPMSSLNVPLAGSSVRNRPDQPIMAVSPGCCLRDVMRELNQLTWFRFRRLIPCAITALDFRLILTDDDSIQIVTAGMVSVPVPATRTCASSYRPVSDTVSHSSNADILGVDIATCDESLFEGGVIDYGSRKAMDCSETQQPVDSSRTDPAFQNNLHGCLLTPLSCVPGMVVDTYLGNLDFFFVRETNDLKEAGGIRGFLHTGLAEVQAVVGAHTSSLGGNVLLSYHLSEVHIFRTASRNHAQCLFNVCGDMARLSPIRVQ
ncbi:unnamed protein product [Dicrocoelium dendriticum]|nr:unnamed protein product [Dicrocoelium dendriticum]